MLRSLDFETVAWTYRNQAGARAAALAPFLACKLAKLSSYNEA